MSENRPVGSYFSLDSRQQYPDLARLITTTGSSPECTDPFMLILLAMIYTKCDA